MHICKSTSATAAWNFRVLLRYNKGNRYWVAGVRKAEREFRLCIILGHVCHTWILHIFAPLFWFYGISSSGGLRRCRQKKHRTAHHSYREILCVWIMFKKWERNSHMQEYQRWKDMLLITPCMSNTSLRGTPSFPHHSLTQNTQLGTELRNHTIKRCLFCLGPKGVTIIDSLEFISSKPSFHWILLANFWLHHYIDYSGLLS